MEEVMPLRGCSSAYETTMEEVFDCNNGTQLYHWKNLFEIPVKNLKMRSYLIGLV